MKPMEGGGEADVQKCMYYRDGFKISEPDVHYLMVNVRPEPNREGQSGEARARGTRVNVGIGDEERSKGRAALLYEAFTICSSAGQP